MSPMVEIDDDIFEYLKSQAEPFTDTPSIVLRRLLNIDGGAESQLQTAEPVRSESSEKPRSARGGKRAKGKKRSRAASGTLLPEQAYEKPLLQALVDSGGEAPYRNVVDAVGRTLAETLKPADFEKLESGGIRWHSRLQFVRLRLVERGELDRDAPRGVWRITDTGRQALTNGTEA